MKSLTLVIGLLVSGSLYATGVRPPSPVEPAYAADQKRVNADSLAYEVAQFRAVAEWNTALDQLEATKAELADMKTIFDRAQELLKIQQISQDRYIFAKFRYESRLIEIPRLEFEIERAKAASEFYRLMVISIGNPERDLRSEIVAARTAEMNAQISALKLQTQIKEEELRLVEGHRVHGQDLNKRGALSQAALDERTIAARLVEEKLRAIRAQMLVAEMTLEGMNRARIRLQTNPAR